MVSRENPRTHTGAARTHTHRSAMATHLAPDAGAKFGWEGMADVPAFTSHDPVTEGWERRRDDPNIQQRRAHLEKNAGIKGLDICSPEEVDRIVTVFLRDGFAAVRPLAPPPSSPATPR